MSETKYFEYTERCLNCKHFGWDEQLQTERCFIKGCLDGSKFTVLMQAVFDKQ